MELKKNWFSFIIWVMVSVLSGTFLAIEVIAFAVSLGFINNDTLIGFVVLSYIFCFAFYEIISTVISHYVDAKHFTLEKKRKLSRTIFILMYLFVLVYRFTIISSNHFVLGSQDVIYYAAANPKVDITAGHSLLEQLYIWLFRIIFRFFGTTQTVAVIFQFVLEQIVLFLVFWVIKQISNSGIATFYFFIISCMQGFHIDKHILTEENLFLLLCLLSIWMYVSIYRYAKDHYRLGVTTEILYAICGFLSGVMAALYVYGWIIVLAFFLTTISESNRLRDDEDKNRNLNTYMPMYAIYLLVSAIVGFVIALVLFSGTSFSILGALNQYADLYFSNLKFSYEWIYNNEYPVMNLVCGILCTFWFFVYLAVPYDFSRLQTLIWFGFCAFQTIGIQSNQFYVTGPIVICLASTSGIIGISYYHVHRLRFHKENRVITFQTDQSLEELRRKGNEEPEAGERGEEDWKQIFTDGRSATQATYATVGTQAAPAVKNSWVREGVHNVAMVANRSIPFRTDVADNSLAMEHSKKVSRTTGIVKIEEPIKQPEKKNKPKLDYSVDTQNVDDDYDFDLLDIPDDDDYDLTE